jgi:G3E family GTPase
MRNDNKTPLTIVTGFLGSGKTTLLSNVLKDPAFAGTSVIINEYGQAGLDHRLIRRIEERTTLLSGGCVCCNRREDLIQELKDMLDAHERGEIPLDRVIVETTGLADPAPILFSILTHPLLIHHYYIDMVIACLDSANGERHLSNNPESVKQIVSADRVILTKTDISPLQVIEDLRQRVLLLNPAVQISTAAHGEVGIDIFDPGRAVLENKPRERLEQLRATQGATGAGHATNIRSMAIQFEKPLDWLAFGIWMSMLLQKHGENMFRVKGIVDVGDKGPVVLNGVQHIIHPPRHLEDWQDYEERNSQIVFIMQNIKPRQILDSLNAFQTLIGAEPEIREINLDPFA